MWQFKPKHIAEIIVAIIAAAGAFFAGKSVQQQQVVNVFVGSTGTEDYETTIEYVQKQLEESKQNASADSQTISDLKSENKTLRDEKDTLETDKNTLQDANDDLQTKIDEAQVKIENMSKENDDLRKICIDNGIDPDVVLRTPQHSGSGVSLTELVDLERNPGSDIIRGSEAATKDDEGTNYPNGIACRVYDERSIEYKLDGKYKYLSGILFITAFGAGSYNGDRWDKMSFAIYADDREIFPGDTYPRPAYGKQMQAIKITDLDIEGVTRIKFVFNNASDNWQGNPLICFGVPRVYE